LGFGVGIVVSASPEIWAHAAETSWINNVELPSPIAPFSHEIILRHVVVIL
jgi:hypothetical protein